MRLFFLPLLFLLAACTPKPLHVTVTSDEFSHEITVVGPFAYDGRSGAMHTWRLRSFINKDTRRVVYQLYFTARYSGSRESFKFAADDTARPLTVTALGSTNCMADNCVKSEAVGMEVSDATLRSHLATGYRVRIAAKTGQRYILLVTPEMIRLQLEAVDRIVLTGVSPSAPPHS